MRVHYGALLLLPLLAQGAAAPLQPDDFAYGMTLQGDGAGALYGFDLPEEVYRHTMRADLGDVRIFNAAGEVVPHLLRQETARQEVRQSAMLPFYPLLADEVGSKGETTLRIVPGEGGAVIDLRSQSAPAPNDRRISSYIIDASALKQPIRRLKLQWQADQITFVSTVVVEQSSDLNQWRPLTSGSLAQLIYGNDRLQRNQLTLPAAHEAYLRISWPMGGKGVTLLSVAAEIAQPGAEAELKWSEATSRAADGTPGRYEFEVNGHYPVQRLQVVLPQENTMVKATLSSSSAPDSNRWQVRYQGILYSLLHEGSRIESGELKIALSNDRYWRLDVAQEGGGIGAGHPVLKLGWQPHRAIFVARGAAPFTLAFGSARAEPLTKDQGLGGWLNSQPGNGSADSLDIKPIAPAALQVLGGEQMLRPPPPPLPWKTWLLWAVLVAGVVAMLGMARTLYRQMNRG